MIAAAELCAASASAAGSYPPATASRPAELRYVGRRGLRGPSDAFMPLIVPRRQPVGVPEGVSVGVAVAVGVPVGVDVGVPVGVDVGVPVGVTVGVLVGVGAGGGTTFFFALV